MTKEEYKELMHQRMHNLYSAFSKLQELFENDEFECNDYICDNYPFEMSFDEYAGKVSDWHVSTMENLNTKCVFK